jgi:hypothetical protein
MPNSSFFDEITYHIHNYDLGTRPFANRHAEVLCPTIFLRDLISLWTFSSSILDLV